ncbi:succinate dehydrogenase, hydrophobic membrane anchor protein [Azospirillum sp.]|uniref:succinate dehydrogenase, hydrophobic membrane anchor protein n=1 Tax=Azospirillum sp. TaxID=34012 RepID=UPI003D721314
MGLEDCPAQNPLPPRAPAKRPGEGKSKDPGSPLTLPRSAWAPPSPGAGEGKGRRLELRLFLAQRLSAMVLAPLVLLHLGVILYAVRGGLSAAEILGRTKGSVLWGGLYGLFVLVVAVHGSIGLRAVLREWIRHPRLADAAALLFAALALVLGFRAVLVLT